MPLIKSKSKKAFSDNVSAEMHAGKPQKQALAIAYSVKRKAVAPKKMAVGGEVAKSVMEEMPISADSITPEEMDMIKQYRRKKMYDGGEVLDADAKAPHGEDMLTASTRHSDEIDARKERMSGIDDAKDEREMQMIRKMAKGGEIDAHDEKMTTIDDAADERDEHMMRGKPHSHGPEKRAASKKSDIDNEDHLGEDMIHEDEVSLPESIADAVMGREKRKKYADGGEVDLSRNADEDHNEEDDLSFEALKKENYSESHGLDDLDYDHDKLIGHDLSDEDEHDMVEKIRRKYRG